MFECQLIEKTSKKTGQKYMAFEITFPSGYKKLVFLTDAEAHLATVSV